MTTASIVLLIILVVLFLLRVPIAFALGISALTALVLFTPVPLEVIAQRMFTGTDSFTLIAVPLFLLAGVLMEYAGVSEKLIALAQAFTGHIRGALGGVTVGASMFFAGISGSGIAETAALGRITIPAMIKRGYHASYAVAIQATAAALGIIIPPSIIMILFSVITGASVAALFIGGIIPGVLFGLALMATGFVIAAHRKYPTEPRSSAGSIGKSLIGAIPAMAMPVIILGGILSGIVTATESAVLAVIYGLILGLVTKKIKIRALPEILMETGMISAMVMLIVANANVFAWVITSQGFPIALAKALGNVSQDPIIALLICTAIYLVAGMFLDTSAALIILVPVLLPFVSLAGVDMVQFGIISVVALAIGLATPPVGINLFIGAGIAKIGIPEAAKGLWPFLLAMLAVLLLLILFPPLVTFLPSLIG